MTGFCDGLGQLMAEEKIRLIGGDTTRGPLSVTIQVMGLVDSGCALRRDGARPGDDIYVSGRVGDAGAGLRLLQQKINPDCAPLQDAVSRLNRPRPRNELGIALTSVASACIDVSDGLLADLGHLLQSSDGGADIDISRIPLAPALTDPALLARLNLRDGSPLGARRFAIAAGDDYELCFTAPATVRAQVAVIAQRAGVAVTRFGTVTRSPGIFDCANGGEMMAPIGYTHF
jgi:thiamine-monophosphate kinase